MVGINPFAKKREALPVEPIGEAANRVVAQVKAKMNRPKTKRGRMLMRQKRLQRTREKHAANRRLKVAVRRAFQIAFAHKTRPALPTKIRQQPVERTQLVERTQRDQ